MLDEKFIVQLALAMSIAFVLTVIAMYLGIVKG